MKKIFVLFAMVIITINCFGQLQKINAGFIFIPQVDVASGDFTKMKPEYALLSNINLITKKTYHNFCYAWGANALIVVNGWVYDSSGKQDIYLVLTKNFSTSGGNVLIAWEYELTSGPIPSYLAIEVGTSWEKWDKPIVNLSLTIPFDVSIWKKKW